MAEQHSYKQIEQLSEIYLSKPINDVSVRWTVWVNWNGGLVLLLCLAPHHRRAEDAFIQQQKNSQKASMNWSSICVLNNVGKIQVGTVVCCCTVPVLKQFFYNLINCAWELLGLGFSAYAVCPCPGLPFSVTVNNSAWTTEPRIYIQRRRGH